MGRRSLLLIVFIGMGLLVGACASPAVSPGESTESESAGGEPSTATAESDSPAESAASSGGAPALADGPWAGGRGQMTVSGGVSLTVDEQLTTGVSETTDAKTLLAYNTDAEFVTIGINFIGVPFHASITANDFSASSEDCEVTYNRADDNGIDATFSCVADEFYWYLAGEEPTDPVMIEGSFTATR